MRTRFEALTDHWVPSMFAPGQQLRARFFVGVCLGSLPIQLVATLVLALLGLWMQVALIAMMMLVCGVSLGWFRKSRSLHGPSRLTYAAATTVLAGTTLCQSPPDFTSLGLLAAIPLSAALTSGSAEAAAWTMFELVIGSVCIWAGANGYTLSTEHPTLWISQLSNFVSLVVLLWMFSRAYASVGEAAFRHLREARQAKTTFLATIGHEIRTPMNGVLGLTEVLLADSVTPGQRDNLKLIQRSGKLMVALINDLLDVTKAEAGKLRIDSFDFDLKRVLDDVKGLFEPVAAKKGVQLFVDLHPQTPTSLRGDGMRLSQVLNNLVSNAVKFTDVGRVTLRVKPASQQFAVSFEVEDTGMGIEPAMLPKLFTAFEQGDGSTKRRQSGTGLGLVLAQQLVTLMGGKITATSQQRRGSQFSFTLAFRQSERTLELTLAPMPLQQLQRGTVLVVDDNPINLAVAAQLVEKAGYTAVKASSGEEALTALSARDVSLVLMDCHMPLMDGFETATRIRSMNNQRASVPIVALTASAAPEDLAACQRSGMNDVLVKPVTLPALSATLQRYLRLAA